MSKQNKRTDYTNYSVKNQKNAYEKQTADEAIEETEIFESLEPVADEIDIEEPVVEDSSLASNAYGIVFGCEKLNVRKEPSINSYAVCQFPCNMEVKIIKDKSVEDWFYVCNAAGVEGYCMKKYINSHK